MFPALYGACLIPVVAETDCLVDQETVIGCPVFIHKIFGTVQYNDLIPDRIDRGRRIKGTLLTSDTTKDIEKIPFMIVGKDSSPRGVDDRIDSFLPDHYIDDAGCSRIITGKPP